MYMRVSVVYVCVGACMCMSICVCVCVQAHAREEYRRAYRKKDGNQTARKLQGQIRLHGPIGREPQTVHTITESPYGICGSKHYHTQSMDPEHCQESGLCPTVKGTSLGKRPCFGALKVLKN